MAQPYIPFYMGDYDRDTSDLNCMEDGAYRRLLSHVWSTGNAIANANANAIVDANAYANAYRIARAFADAEQAAVQKIINRYFIYEQGQWRNIRAEVEYQKANKKRENNRKTALDAWAKKKEEAMRSHMQTQERSHMQPEPEPEPIDLNNNHAGPERVRVRDIKAVENDVKPSPEQRSDFECEEDEFAYSGWLYAKNSNNPNWHTLSWLEGYLSIQYGILREARPEISVAELSRVWRDTVDSMAEQGKGNANFIKATFEGRIRDWKPKPSARPTGEGNKNPYAKPTGSITRSTADINADAWKTGQSLSISVSSGSGYDAGVTFKSSQIKLEGSGISLGFRMPNGVFLGANNFRKVGPFDTPFVE